MVEEKEMSINEPERMTYITSRDQAFDELLGDLKNVLENTSPRALTMYLRNGGNLRIVSVTIATPSKFPKELLHGPGIIKNNLETITQVEWLSQASDITLGVYDEGLCNQLFQKLDEFFQQDAFRVYCKIRGEDCILLLTPGITMLLLIEEERPLQ